VCVGVQGAAPSRPQQDHRDTNPEVRRLGHRHRPPADGQEKQIVFEACPPDWAGSKWPKNHEIVWVRKCVPVDMDKIIFRAKSFASQLKSVNWETIKEQNLQFRRCT